MDKPDVLPVHGFVLAGGRSSRMGTDKAMLRFRGRPMVEIAVEKLRKFCADVSLAGNRDDLAEYAEVVREERVNAGPAAGMEAGLRAAKQPWAMFMPVDVPLLPMEFLRRWAEDVLRMEGLIASYLYDGSDQAAFCMLRRDCADRFSAALDAGERRLSALIQVAAKGGHWVCDMNQMCAGGDERTGATRDRWLMNLNTREELAKAEAWEEAKGI